MRENEEFVCGQRFLGCALKDGKLTLRGTPGNALGAYLDGGTIEVFGNAQDAVGDTMNAGKIIVHGMAGDALGYAMRGGAIFIRGNAGYRTGIHMKEYGDKRPVLVVGGSAGSFLGEYLAGGLILVLNLAGERSIVGNFTGTGMHGGKIFLRTGEPPASLPAQVAVSPATEEDLAEIAPYVEEFAGYFHLDVDTILNAPFQVLRPNAQNPYRQLYTAN